MISTNDLASPYIYGISCDNCGIVIEGEIRRTPGGAVYCTECDPPMEKCRCGTVGPHYCHLDVARD